MRIKGKKLTVSQKNILQNNGISQPDDYLYVKMETINLGDGRRLNQRCPKIENMVVIHRETGDVKRVQVKEV